MTSRTIIAALGLFLAVGCTQMKALFTPAPQPSPAYPERREPPPRLSPQMSSDREKRVMDEANAVLRRAERTFLSIDQRKLKADQQETYLTIHSFLTQARTALAHKDFPKAMNLAQKAQVLSDELSTTLR